MKKKRENKVHGMRSRGSSESAVDERGVCQLKDGHSHSFHSK